MNKEEASKIISDKLKQTETLISECMKIADEHGLVFSSPLKNKHGRSLMRLEYIGKNRTINEEDDNESYNKHMLGNWISSSDFC